MINDQTDLNSSNSKPERPQRPWDLLQKSKLNDFEYEEAPVLTEKSSSPDTSKKAVSKVITDLVKSHQRLMILSFAISALMLGAFAATVQSTFYSTLHLYAPERSDSIGTRLSLFTQRLEYASFPVDYKTPISLVSRRLREDVAKLWVIEKLKKDSTNTEEITEDTVSVETSYIPTQEILAIEGYANTPDLASKVTQYYWDFLNADVRSIEEEQQIKIRRWFDLTNASLDQQISNVIKEIEILYPKTFQKNGVARIQDSLGEVFSTLELSLTSLQKQLINLKSLKTRTDFIGITESLDSETAAQLRIYNQLILQKEVISPAQINEERTRILEIISKRIGEIEFELQTISSGQISAENQMVRMNSKENRIKVATEQDYDLRTQLITLRSQKSDLLKFKSQIEMEASIRSPTFKPIRMPTPNPSSIRPLPVVKYALVMLISVLISLIVVLCYHYLFSKKKRFAVE